MNEAIPVKEIKETLQGVYDEMKLDRRAKATNIDSLYKTQDCTIRKDGKNVAAKRLLFCLILRATFFYK